MPQTEELKPDQTPKDQLIEDAATRLLGSVYFRMDREITQEQVAHELHCMKYGKISEDIPLNMEVYKQLAESGISILYKEKYEPKSYRRCFVNHPGGRQNLMKQ